MPECEVRAFGSRTTWTAKDYSDLDLAVVGKGPMDWRTLGRLKEAFEESDLPMRVDVLDWHSISESFRKVIERDYVVLQDGVSVDGAVPQSEWRKGTVGAVHYLPNACWPIDTTFFVTGDDAALVRFKYYALSTLGLERMNSDSAVLGSIETRPMFESCSCRMNRSSGPSPTS